MHVGVRFYVDSWLWHIWCDGGNKTYFVSIFRMLFRVNHLLCLCVCVRWRCVFSPFYVCLGTTIFTMRIADNIQPFHSRTAVYESHYYLFQFKCLRCTRWVLFYLTLVLLSSSQLCCECMRTIERQAQCTHGMLIYRQFRCWYLFYSRNGIFIAAIFVHTFNSMFL